MQQDDVHSVFSRAGQALRNRTITKQEHDALLMHKFGTTDERAATAMMDGEDFTHRSVALVCGFAVVMVSLLAALLFGTGGITAAVVGVDGRPELIMPIPDSTGSRVSLDLSLFFSGAATYESARYEGNDERIAGSTLTLTGTPGTYVYVVYASGGKAMVSSNPFLVTLQ